MTCHAKDFPFLITPDKNNKDLILKLNIIENNNNCANNCRACPFESKGGIGCFSFHPYECRDKNFQELVSFYKELFFKVKVIQEEMNV